jgi:23S rRNA (cytidine2498-2'-O)-methyltransferase
LAPEGFLAELQTELGDAISETHGRLILTDAPEQPVAWCANVWRDPRRLPVASISDAARQLRAMQRNWALYSATSHRRDALIEANLPNVSARALAFGTPPPETPRGSWTLLDGNTLLAAATCSCASPNGEAHFVEDHTAPPSRA